MLKQRTLLQALHIVLYPMYFRPSQTQSALDTPQIQTTLLQWNLPHCFTCLAPPIVTKAPLTFNPIQQAASQTDKKVKTIFNEKLDKKEQ